MKRTLGTIVACLAIFLAVSVWGSVGRSMKGSAAMPKPARKTIFSVGPECCTLNDGKTAVICHREGGGSGQTITPDCNSQGPTGHQNHEDDTCGPCTATPTPTVT